ncbi:UDP-N-acetylglucosamine 2-epimerase [Planomicrobium okeanokoites]|uniref:UDP-N-acetylglucosamine 2-epimerase n=1 Tax=Planomicrobium okeanokoites TaxID=244 RepID=UPI0009FDDB36|nr:UDP-N-acetylglucosamine 2-epimerase [Planomicrobium okeanokoites]
MKKKICVVTGTRADYGLLYWMMKEIVASKELELQLVVTGTHLSPEFGNTYKEIEADGFNIREQIEIILSSDTAVSTVKSLGLATLGFAEALERLKPDMLLVVGDRYEILAASQSALIMQIPIAHIHGGELTFGAYDDAIRHAVTKMAKWHFTSSEEHKNRVIQMGEFPSVVWNVGALGIDNIINIPLLDKEKLLTDLSLPVERPFFLITYHPETNNSEQGIEELLSALAHYDEMTLIFTKANADNGGRFINERISDFVRKNENSYVYDSLGQLRYLSAAKHAEVVIGNSSSGLIEVPYLKTPVIDCGERQKGRQKPSCVLNVKLDSTDIRNGIEQALNYVGPFDQIFGDGKTAQKIIRILEEVSSNSSEKEFYDI